MLFSSIECQACYLSNRFCGPIHSERHDQKLENPGTTAPTPFSYSGAMTRHSPCPRSIFLPRIFLPASAEYFCPKSFCQLGRLFLQPLSHLLAPIRAYPYRKTSFPCHLRRRAGAKRRRVLDLPDQSRAIPSNPDQSRPQKIFSEIILPQSFCPATSGLQEI